YISRLNAYRPYKDVKDAYTCFHIEYIFFMKRTQNTIYIVYNKYRNTQFPIRERIRYSYIIDDERGNSRWQL
ncbi:hypothetical protein CA598_29770, partial [Paenibacillus sp. VTT E-133291]